MLEQRHLNFNKFLQQRAEEIGKFRNILKLQTKKKGHQSLPKAVRRRAMSHNRFRIPLKMRKLNEEQLIKSENMQRIPKSRKHIRKRHRLILSYKQRFGKIQWLSNHLWAAKRMRMIDYYGYKIAQTPNEKMFRTSYRHFRHNCCLVDFSYYQCLALKFVNEESKIPSNIQIFDSNQKQRTEKIFDLNLLKNNQTYQGLLYNNNKKLVCPLIVFFTPNQDFHGQKYNEIKCFFDPCVLEQVKLIQFQKSISVNIQKCKSQLYCLIGPEWANKIQQAAKIYGSNLENNFVEKLKYNNFGAISLTSKAQKVIEKAPYISKPTNSMIKQNLNCNQMSQSIRLKTLQLFEYLKSKNKVNNLQEQNPSTYQFWKFYNSIVAISDQISFKISTRSKYTHKRKNKISKQNKKKVASLQKQKKQLIISSRNLISEDDPDSVSHSMISQQLQNLKNQIKQIFIEQKKDIKQQKKIKEYNVNPILISSFKYETLYEGCFILSSDQDNCRVWRILSKLNLKVIGIQELKQIQLESQYRYFPIDFPETEAFKQYCLKQSQRKLSVIKKRPPQKRINFMKLNSTNPLSSFQGKLLQQQITKVFVEMVSKGRCFQGSYIYELLPDDIAFIQKHLEQNGQVGIILSETSKQKFFSGNLKQLKNVDYSKQGIEQLNNKLSILETKRKLIGRVTSGGYLFSKCKEGGIGYVNKTILEGQQLKNEGYVLIRKVSSGHYYLGVITKLY